jgi:hypothetical protein
LRSSDISSDSPSILQSKPKHFPPVWGFSAVQACSFDFKNVIDQLIPHCGNMLVLSVQIRERVLKRSGGGSGKQYVLCAGT